MSTLYACEMIHAVALYFQYTAAESRLFTLWQCEVIWRLQYWYTSYSIWCQLCFYKVYRPQDASEHVLTSIRHGLLDCAGSGCADVYLTSMSMLCCD